MRSSTLHSNRTPVLAVKLFALAAITWACAALYTIWLNPEVRFYSAAARIKVRWARHLEGLFPAKYVVGGGSSCAFSIDGERLLRKDRLPVANFGMHAGMGPLFLTAFAAKATAPSDTLVVALEPASLQEKFEIPDLAAQMSIALHDPFLMAASRITDRPVPWLEAIISLRPGAYHLFTLAGKIALRKPLYRYSEKDLNPSGFQRTDFRLEILDPDSTPRQLSPDGRQFLQRLKTWGAQQRVRVIYSLPWRYVKAAAARPIQLLNIDFMLEMMDYLPVLKDETLGIDLNREDFADTEWHLTGNGAARRTDAFGDQLLHNRYWSRAELEERREKILAR